MKRISKKGKPSHTNTSGSGKKDMSLLQAAVQGDQIDQNSIPNFVLGTIINVIDSTYNKAVDPIIWTAWLVE